MRFENELELIEREKNVNQAIDFLNDKERQNLDYYLRILFVLLDFLVEEQYTEEQYEFYSKKINEIFFQTKLEYFDNEEFLFFMGIMICMGDYIFGFDSFDEGTTMLEVAMKAKPDNPVFKWGAYVITDQRIDINTELKHHLSMQVLNNSQMVDWLQTKGLLGKYVLGMIQSTYELTQP